MTTMVRDCQLVVTQIVPEPQMTLSPDDSLTESLRTTTNPNQRVECASHSYYAEISYTMTSGDGWNERPWYEWAFPSTYVTEYSVKADMELDCRDHLRIRAYPSCYANDAETQPAGDYVVTSCGGGIMWGGDYYKCCERHTVAAWGTFGDSWNAPYAGSWSWSSQVILDSSNGSFTCDFWISDGFGPPADTRQLQCIHYATSKSGRQTTYEVGDTVRE